MTSTDLLARLRQVDPPDGDENRTRWYRNPDGLEAADRIKALEAVTEAAHDLVNHLWTEHNYNSGETIRLIHTLGDRLSMLPKEAPDAR